MVDDADMLGLFLQVIRCIIDADGPTFSQIVNAVGIITTEQEDAMAVALHQCVEMRVVKIYASGDRPRYYLPVA